MENILLQVFGIFSAILVAYGFDKWAEYKAFLRTRDNLHNWSRRQREHLWAVIKSEAEAATEPWAKAVQLKVEAENAKRSMYFAIDSFRINFAHRITAAIEQNLQDERTFWQQLGATFDGRSALLNEGIKAGDTEEVLVKKHIEWSDMLIERSDRLDKLSAKTFRKTTPSSQTSHLIKENLRPSLEKFFTFTVPYYMQRLGKPGNDEAHDRERELHTSLKT